LMNTDELLRHCEKVIRALFGRVENKLNAKITRLQQYVQPNITEFQVINF